MSTLVVTIHACASWEVGGEQPKGTYIIIGYMYVCIFGGFLKWWYPTTMGFHTKNDHFGVFWGTHNFRKHPYRPSNFSWFWWVLVWILLLQPTGRCNSGAAFEEAQGDGLPTSRCTESTPRMRERCRDLGSSPVATRWLFWRSVKAWWMFCFGWQNVRVNQSERSNFSYTCIWFVLRGGTLRFSWKRLRQMTLGSFTLYSWSFVSFRQYTLYFGQIVATKPRVGDTLHGVSVRTSPQFRFRNTNLPMMYCRVQFWTN